jgi:hypothetical protein
VAKRLGEYMKQADSCLCCRFSFLGLLYRTSHKSIKISLKRTTVPHFFIYQNQASVRLTNVNMQYRFVTVIAAGALVAVSNGAPIVC